VYVRFWVQSPALGGKRKKKALGTGNSKYVSKYVFKRIDNRAGRMAKVIESMPSKCEALSSNPLPTIKKELTDKGKSNALKGLEHMYIKCTITTAHKKRRGKLGAGATCLLILATQEAEIRRITV
jgi:hypothetical protein